MGFVHLGVVWRRYEFPRSGYDKAIIYDRCTSWALEQPVKCYGPRNARSCPRAGSGASGRLGLVGQRAPVLTVVFA